MRDIEITNHDSVVLIRPLTLAGEEWIADNVRVEPKWLGNALAVEPGEIDRLVAHMQNDGLTIQ